MKYLHACVLHGLENITQGPNRILKDKLAEGKDLVTQDNTVIRLASRTKKIAAGVKVCLLISAVARGERTSDVKTLLLGPWIKHRILLIDLGFYKPHIFARCQQAER